MFSVRIVLAVIGLKMTENDTNSNSFVFNLSYDWPKNVGWPWLKSLHCNKIDVSFLRVCPVIDHELHNIIKVAVHLGDPQTTLTTL